MSSSNESQTVANILKRRGLESARKRGRKALWQEYIRSDWDMLAASGFFTTEVWARRGLISATE